MSCDSGYSMLSGPYQCGIRILGLLPSTFTAFALLRFQLGGLELVVW